MSTHRVTEKRRATSIRSEGNLCLALSVKLPERSLVPAEVRSSALVRRHESPFSQVRVRYPRYILLAACVLTIACDATPPTAPSATLDRIIVLYSRPVRPGEAFQAQAYTIDSDSAYTEVTNQTQWTSSNPTIVSVATGSSVGGKTLSPNAPGTAIITAAYQGVAGHLPVRVPPRPNPPNQIGPLRVSIESALLRGAGEQLRLSVSFFTSRFMDVTSEANWSTSEPSVATVDRGVVTLQRIGTAEITATYAGASDSYLISVHPGLGTR